MQKYKNLVNESIIDISKLSLETKENYDIAYDKVKQILEKINFNDKPIEIFPLGEYLSYTNVANITPYKIGYQIKVNRKDIIAKIKYNELNSKRKLSAKNHFLKNSLQTQVEKVFLNTEIAHKIYQVIKKDYPEMKVISKQNCVLLKLEDIYEFVIIVIYNFNETENESIFKYKSQKLEVDMQKYIENFNVKIAKTNELYLYVVQFLKYLEIQFYTNELKQAKAYDKLNYYENVLYNVPDNLFCNNVFDSIINALNYLRNANLKDFKAIDNKNLVKNSNELNFLKQFINYVEDNFLNISKLEEFNI